MTVSSGFLFGVALACWVDDAAFASEVVVFFLRLRVRFFFGTGSSPLFGLVSGVDGCGGVMVCDCALIGHCFAWVWLCGCGDDSAGLRSLWIVASMSLRSRLYISRVC